MLITGSLGSSSPRTNDGLNIPVKRGDAVVATVNDLDVEHSFPPERAEAFETRVAEYREDIL